MKKSILALLFLFSTGIAFSQTTVTLQDQCNCEVLKGTDVSGSGATTPAGADLGDIYVNTNTGTIYFWDGDTWELTASDDQQLTGFTFNDATNTLSLTLENGGSVNVDLSSLSDTLTDSNTTVTSFGIDGTNTNLVITDSDSNTFAVALADLAALIDTDTQLTDAQVATAVNNEFPNLDTDSTDDFSGDFGDLTNVPANLDTDSTDDFDGQWSSLTGVPADFADNVDNVDDADNDPANELQTITSTDGTVTVTPNGNDFDLSGFSGDFGDLSNVPANLDTDSTDDFSGDFNDLTNVPANLDLDSTDDFDGQWSSLTGVPAGFADNIDNDTQLTDAQVATAVNNEFPNLDTDSTDDFSGDFGDLTNVPANLDLDSTDDFSGDFNDLTNVPANLDTDSTDDFSGDFGDLTNVPANLDLDSTDDFDGQWSSLTGVPADFADNVDNVDDADNDPANELQTITSTDGTVTVTPNGNDFDLSGFSGDFGDLSNVPANLDTDSTDDFSGDFNDLTNVPANLDTDSTDDFSGDFGDLTNVPANLDLDATDDFDGQWSSLTGVPADFADNVDNVDDADNDPSNELQAITSTDGTVTVTPNGNDFDLSGFSGDFGDLANVPANLDTDSTDDFSGDFGDLTNVPANLDLDSTDDFDGQWSSLTGVPADFADNVDNVDDADNDPANELQAITSTDGTVTVTPNGNDFDLSGFSGDFGDLSNVPANLDTDSTDDFDGQWSSLTGVPAGFADNIDNDTQLTDAQVATAVNNEFPNLDTDSTDDFSGDFGDLTNVPANLDLDSTDDFDGQWSSLTGVPADFADNVDNVDDADSVVGNEYNTGSSITDGVLGITDGGGTEQVDLISNDANNNITFGSDGALYLNVASVSIAETITNLTDNNNGTVTYVNENGVSQTINKSAITDNLDGTYTFDNGDGSPITFIGTDNDTQLTDAQVATAVNNEFPNLDTDSTDDFDGQWSSLTGVPADFADNVDNVDDADNDPANELQAITSTDGTVTVTPNGNDFDLSSFSGDFGDLTNVPANLDLDATDDFDGQWGSLTGIPADFADNVDNVDDADSVVGNEYNTGSSITDGVLGITDGGGTEQVDLISNDANNNITFGSDGALYLNVASVSIAETITNLTDNNNGSVTYVNENGVSQTINKSAITDNLDGTYTFDNGDGSPITFIGTDNDTQLTDAQVATAVNNEFPNLDTDSTDDFSGDFNDLTNVPANLDLDATDDFDGQWSSLTGIPADFADNVDNVDDADNDPANELQAITSTDGTVTVTPNGNDFDLSGFSGDFGDLSNVPANLDTDSTDDFSGDFNDLTNVPANLDTDSTDDFSGDFNDLTNVPANLDLDFTDDFDGQWSSLTGVPAGFADNIDNDTQLTDAQVATAVNNEFPNLDTDSTDDFSGDFGDLTNVPANLDLDSTDDFDGQWSSLTGVPADFADNVDNVDDADNDPANELQAITSTDGTVTVTPNGNDFDLSGFSGDFGDLSNVPANLDTDSTDDFSGDFGDLTNVPANLDLDSTDDFDGQWSSLTGIPADFADNVDNVDDADNDPANELQAITSTDGTVTVTPNGNDFDLSGFSGDFGDLSNVPANLDTDSTDDFSGDFGDLTNVPANLDLDSTDDFDGQWSSLTGVPADFADNVDNVDDADNDPANELQAITSTDGTVTVTPNGNDFDLSGFSGDFGDLSNVPANLDTDSTDDFSGDFNDLTNVPANLDTDSTDDFSGDFGDLTNVPANLDLDATDDFDGQWSSLTGIPADFADNVDNVDDADNDPANELQAITSTDGTVTVTPNGNDFDLSGFSGDFGDLSNVPANLDTDSTDDFDGQWSSLTGVPAGFADNIDNDTQLTDAQVATAVNNEFPNLDTDSTDDFSGDFGDLTNVPANLDLDSTDDFDGQWGSLTGVPVDFADNVDNVDDADNDPANELQAITSTDGTVTVTPNGNDFDLSGFSGDFGDLSNVPANLDTDSTDDFSGDFGDLTNVPANLDLDSTDDFDGQWSSLTGIPADFADNVDNVDDADNDPANELQAITSTDGTVTVTPNGNDFDLSGFSGDFGDLTNVPANLDLDSTDDFDGQWGSLAGVPADFADNVDNVDDADNDPANELQAITSTDGTVTVTPNGNDFDLSGFSGDFGDLSNVPANLDTDSTDDFSGDFGDLTNVPANLDLDSTDDFDGQWSSLTGVPADFADNVDNVDDADNDPANELQAITSTDGTVTVTPNGNDFDLSGFSGDFGDLSNVPANLDTDSTDDFSGDFNDLTNVPANLDTDSTDDFSGDFGDLTNVPANLDLDSTDDFDGQWSSLTGVPADFADNVDNVDDADNDPANELQAITSTDGTVTVTPNGNDFDLSGFSGDFGDLSNVPANLDTDSTDDFSGDFGDLTNVPANLDLDSTDDFDGQWSSLTGVPAGFADNIDNDTQLTDAQVATAVNNEFPNLDTDSTDDFDGQWGSLAGVPADFADNVDNVDDADNDPANELQAITSTDGTVTVTPNGNDFDLSGFSGDFGDLSNVPANLDTDSTDDFSGDFGDLTNVPANLDLDSTDDFDGQWSSLTGVPADFADNVDNVDDADASVTNEINTRFEVNGANLEIEDSNGTLQVALADIDTDDQTAAQVNSDSPVDVDGDGNTEATVEDVIQDIAPITSKAARIFYPPSIAIDASTNGTGRTVDLYAQYVAQYGTPAVSSAGAPTALPTYSAAELYYYVTYADPTVFDNMSIDANGVLTYDIIGQPADYNALINVVFVVR
ncbi:MAG: beta strand repeat-containing protein [Allomuricauda sp.]